MPSFLSPLLTHETFVMKPLMSSTTIIHMLILVGIASLVLATPFHHSRQLPPTPPSAQSFPSIEDAERCIEYGYMLGIVGMLTKAYIFIKASFLWMRRSSFPPFAKSEQVLKSKWIEYPQIMFATVGAIVSLGSGIAFAAARKCEDQLFQVMHALTLYFNYAVDLGVIVFAIRRSIRIWKGEDSAPKNTKLIFIVNVWLGINGWLHWAAVGRMAYWGTPLSVSIAVPAAYWAIVFVLALIGIFKGYMRVITGIEGKFWNGVLLIIFWGGFASAVFAELVGGLAYDTITKVPPGTRYSAVLSWVFTFTTVLGQFATAS